jgi:putative hydrolase of the HAD superfamily
MAKIKAVFLDVDNTMLDFYKMKTLCVEAAVNGMLDAGLKMRRSEATKKIYELYDDYGIEYKDVLQEFLKKVLGKIDYKILIRGIIAYRKMRDGVLTAYPEVKSTLVKLKKKRLKLAVLSDAPLFPLWSRLCATGMDELFDLVISAEEVGAEKPNPKIFKEAMTKLKVNPEQCIMVGDMPGKDVKGAKDLGIKSVLVAYRKKSITDGYEKDADIKPDYEIKYFRDLITLINKLNKN